MNGGRWATTRRTKETMMMKLMNGVAGGVGNNKKNNGSANRTNIEKTSMRKCQIVSPPISSCAAGSIWALVSIS